MRKDKERQLQVEKDRRQQQEEQKKEDEERQWSEEAERLRRAAQQRIERRRESLQKDVGRGGADDADQGNQKEMQELVAGLPPTRAWANRSSRRFSTDSDEDWRTGSTAGSLAAST